MRNRISKQIDELRAYAKKRKGELAKLINDAADTIELLSAKLHASQMERSSQYYHDGWIPCEERLPEEYGEYRITWTTSASKKRFIGDAEFEVTGKWDAKYDRFKGEWLLGDYINAYPDVKVIAWKPLEEPYKGGAQE